MNATVKATVNTARAATGKAAGAAPGHLPAIVVGLWRGRYLRFTGQQFVLLAAPARSGKGVGIVVPNLLSYPDSAVVLDIKQENFRITAGFRAAHGQQVFLFNPFAEDFRTHRYNPLSAISDGVFRVGDILAIGYALYPAGGHDDFWKDQARNLFLGLVLLLCELRDVHDSVRESVRESIGDSVRDGAGESGQPARRKGTTPDVPDYPVTMGEVLRQSSGNGMPLRRYLQMTLRQFNQHLSGACVDALNRFLSNDDKVLASILATFNAPLTIWANPIVDAATSANDFDLRQVRMKRMTVYIGITPDHLPEAALLVNLLFSQLVNLNTKQLPQDNAELRYQCLLLMDEFTAIGKVDIIAKAVSYMAGYNLRLLPIIQSVSQLESVYGRADARTFVTNHAMQILYAPREQKDANEYSEMLGTFTEKSRSVSRPSGWFGGRGASESVSDQRRALLLPQELKEIGQTKEIILLENTPPILAEKICYWKDPVFIERLRPAPAIPVLDVALFRARLERRVRALSIEDVDTATQRLTGTPADYLEVLAAWDERDLPADMADISEQAASVYVNRHLAFIGVPQPAIAEAERALSLAELEGGELQAEPTLAPAAAAAVVDGLFAQVAGDEADTGDRSTPAGEQGKTSRKRGPRKSAGAASRKQPDQQPDQPKRTKGKRPAASGDEGVRP